jgi:hypothetical protein
MCLFIIYITRIRRVRAGLTVGFRERQKEKRKTSKREKNVVPSLILYFFFN